MILIYLFVFCILWFIVVAIFDVKKIGDLDWAGGVIGSVVVGAIIILATIITNSAGYYNQIYDIENLDATNKKVTLYEGKLNILESKFTTILGDEYPKHEKSIFDNMTPEDIEIFLVKYPEIKSSTTAMNLVEKILFLNFEMYEQKEKLIDITRDLKVRERNIWYIQFFIPTYIN